MAENEILDVGSGWHFQKWRRALNNPTQDAEEKARLLREELVTVTWKRLSGEPLLTVLQACKQSPEALRSVIENSKCRDLAVLVKRAYDQDASANPVAMAMTIVDCMIDQIRDRARLYALTNAKSQEQAWHENLYTAVNANLENCRAELTTLISHSLTDLALPKPKRKTGRKRSSREIVNRSLVKSDRPHVPGDHHRV